MSDLTITADPAEVGLDPARLQRLDRRLARWVDDGQLPGFLVTVARHGRLAHIGIGGLRHVEDGLPVETTTRWRIYSMTKAVTSVAAMMLYEEGAFQLTDPIRQWLPEFAGTRVYVACMMSDELLTIDPGAFSVSARIALGNGTPASHAEHMKMETREDSMMMAAAAKPKPKVGAASSTLTGQNPDCLTTYVSVAPNDSLLYLACNHSNELQVRDATTLALVRRLPTGAGAYNVEPSPDGRLVFVTNKKDKSVSVFDTRTWTEAKRIPTSKRIPHGLAFSPDGRYAFVTCESVGTDPGAIDAIDLSTLSVVASMPLALQPTGVAVWRGATSVP